MAAGAATASSRIHGARLAYAWLCALALAALLAGCAAPIPKVMVLKDDAEGAAKRAPIVWPAPPDVPRYAWAGQLLGEVNFKDVEKKQFDALDALRWLVGLVVGDDKPVMLRRPLSGAVDAAGRIYVTDMGRPTVYVFDPVAGELKDWGAADGARSFVAPSGIAIGPGGDILVADAELGLVARLDAKGDPRAPIGKGLLQRPAGLAYDAQGHRIYVADAHAHDIKVFDEQGRLQKTIGRRGEAPGEFNFPTHLAFANGRLYVSDSMNARIQVLDAADDTVKLSFGKRGNYLGDLVRPKGVAADSEGNIYVVESLHDHLLVYNRDGQFLLPLGGTGGDVGQFFLPAGVWVDRNNRVFVADMFNARVMIFQFLGGSKDGQ